MTNSCWRTVLLGGRRGKDGLFDFQRPVLFLRTVQYCRAWADDASAVYVRAPEEAEFGLSSVLCAEGESFSQRLCAAALPSCGEILVCETPVPTAGKTEWNRLQQLAAQKTRAVIAVLQEQRIAAAVFRAETLCAVLRKEPQSLEQAVTLAQQCGDERVDCILPRQHPMVSSAASAYQAQQILQRRKAQQLMDSGVTIYDLQGTWIAPDAQIGAGTVILPGSLIYPGCIVGKHCTIGPNSVLEKVQIGDRTTVNHSQIRESRIGSDSMVGPFAYVRPHCTIGDCVKIGDFVEVKNTTVGNDTMASHLTYLGDADVGERVNFGCGTVIVNYDGVTKHRTQIGDDCFIGCNTNLVAPIQLGDRVFTAAGSTVTDSVPDGALAIARVRQQTKNDWNDYRRAQRGGDDSDQS